MPEDYEGLEGGGAWRAEGNEEERGARAEALTFSKI